MIWMRLLKFFVAIFMLEKIKNMFCLIYNNNKAIKYALNIRPNNIQEKAKYFYINSYNIVYNTSKKNSIKKKKLLFLLSKDFHCFANRRQAPPFHILKLNNNTQRNSLFLFDHNFSKLKLCSPNYLGATRSFNSVFLNRMEGGEDKYKSNCNNEMANGETNDTSEQNDRIQRCILKKKANFITDFNDEKENKIQKVYPNCDEHEIKQSIPDNGCNNDFKKNNIFTIEELEEMRKNSNYVKIDDTENNGFSIELYFDYKELKLLRKKDEPLSSLKNRLILNLNKLYQKQSKQLNSKKNNNANKTIDDNVKSEKEKENTTIVKFYDKENNIIDENCILKDAIDKLNYLVIDEHKISIYKNVYDLKKIYVSMDVYANHQIIPVHLPLGQMENYIYYWVDNNEKNVLNSCDIFYKPTNDDISKKIQLVIYDKKNPIFFHVTEEMEVKSNPFEEQIRMKEQRYSDFLPQPNQYDNNNARSTLRILSYNILAPIYTNTKYALEYMFKNIDPCYLKTNYRSHLLIGEISHDFDIITLQEVSEHLHTNLFYVYLYENYYSSYKPKSPSGNDGCSLFVNKKKFSLLEYENCEFNTVVRSPELKNIYDIFIKLSDDLDEIIKEIKTVYQIGIFMHNNSQNIFIIANTHLYFHSLAQHIRVMQVYCILHILEKIKDKYKEKYKNKEIYVILNGDFNANFESEVFSFMQGSDVMENSKLWENAKLFKKEYDDLDKYPTLFNIDNNSTDQKINGPCLNRKKFLPLYSAYKKVDISYTNWNNNFIDVLDYIFLSPELKVKRVLKEVDKHLFGQYKGIVTPFNPSDHLSIAAEIEL